MQKPYHPGFTLKLSCLFAAGVILSGTFECAAAAEAKIYGQINQALQFTANHGETANRTQMLSGFSGGSRFGIDVSERLTDTLLLKARLENGFTSDDGAFVTDGTLFSRQSTVALKSSRYGEFAVGRSGKVLSGASGYTRIGGFLPFHGLWGDAGLLFYGKGARMDNALFYQSPTLGGFTFLSSASLSTSGDEVSPWRENQRYIGASLDFKAEHFGFLIGLERTEIPHSEKADGSASPTTAMLMAYADAGVVRLFGALQAGENLDRLSALKAYKVNGRTLKVTGVSARNIMLGAKAPLAGGTLRASVLYSRNTNDGNFVRFDTDRADYWALGLGYDYNLSKRTNVFAAVSHLEGRHALKNASREGDGDIDRTSFTLGIQHKF